MRGEIETMKKSDNRNAPVIALKISFCAAET
jgi:hypothetical protein